VGGQVLISEATHNAVKTPITVTGAVTLEPKGVTRPITIYEVGGLGGNYRLALPVRAHQRAPVDKTHPLTFQLVTDRGVSSEKHHGLLIGLSAEEAEIRSTMRPPLYADLKLLLIPDNPAEPLSAVYGKVIHSSSADASFVLRFTAVAEEARRYFNVIERRAIGSEADAAAVSVSRFG
jgi:adenylate cyclase